MFCPQKELIYSTLSSEAYWQVNKKAAKILGIESALLLSYFISTEKYFYLNDKLTEDGEFYRTQDSIEQDTTLSPHKQRDAIEAMQEVGIISIVFKGLPRKKFYKLNAEAILKMLSPDIGVVNDKSLKNLMTSHKEILPLYNKNKYNKNKEETYGEIKTSKHSEVYTKTINMFPVEMKDNPKFSSHWEEWIKYKKERKSPMTLSTAKLQAKKLELISEKYSIEVSCEVISKSIENGWIGLFEPKIIANKSKHTSDQSIYNTKPSIRIVNGEIEDE